jgi:hypothetical protein
LRIRDGLQTFKQLLLVFDDHDISPDIELSDVADVNYPSAGEHDYPPFANEQPRHNNLSSSTSASAVWHRS